MGTAKPRITVTLSDESYAVVKAISEFGGKPMSTFVADMLEEARPTLERMAATFQKIKRAQDAERARFIKNVDAAQAAIEPVVMETLGQFDLFLGRVEKAADAVAAGDAAGAPAATAAAAPSPRTNRGDTPTRGKGRKPSGDKALTPVSKKRVSKKTAG